MTTTLCVSFLSGRFSGIFLSTRFTPKVMVVATNLGFGTIIFPILSPCPPQLPVQLSPTSQHSWLGVGEPLHRHGDHGLLHLHASRLWLCMAGRPGGHQWVTLLKSVKGQLLLLKGGHDWVPKQCRLPGRKFWLADIPTNRFGI